MSDEPQSESQLPQADLGSVPAPVREALSHSGLRPQEISTTLAAFSATATWTGPLPPADQVEAYERVLPGSFNRLLSMAERQQDHRIDLEKTVASGSIARARHGMYLGFALAVIVLAIGAAAIFTGHQTAGLAGIIAPAAVLAAVFAVGRIDQRRERVHKDALTRLFAPPGGSPGQDLGTDSAAGG